MSGKLQQAARIDQTGLTFTPLQSAEGEWNAQAHRAAGRVKDGCTGQITAKSREGQQIRCGRKVPGALQGQSAAVTAVLCVPSVDSGTRASAEQRARGGEHHKQVESVETKQKPDVRASCGSSEVNKSWRDMFHMQKSRNWTGSAHLNTIIITQGSPRWRSDTLWINCPAPADFLILIVNLPKRSAHSREGC